MGSPSSTRHNESAYDLFDRWLAHREQEADDAVAAHDDGAPAADVVELAPPAEEPPAVELAPPAEEPPAVELAPPAEEPPAVELAPPAEEPPAVELAPPAEEPPAVELAPPAEEPPAVELAPPAEEPPAVELAPPAEEPPAVELPAPVATPPGLGFETAGRTDDEDAEVIQTEEEFEEFAHPALGGATGAPSSLGTEAAEDEAAALPVPTRSPVTTGAPAAARPTDTPTQAPGSAPAPTRPPTPVRRPTAAPPPGLVLFSPRRGARHILTGVAAVLAGATGIAGYLAWQAPTSTSIGVAAGLALALFLAWKLRGAANSTAITIEHGVLRVVQGHSVHQFPLTGSHPQIDVLGEPGRRSWKVLIQRRGMPPYAITRRMVEPVEFTDALRHFRPDA